MNNAEKDDTSSLLDLIPSTKINADGPEACLVGGWRTLMHRALTAVPGIKAILNLGLHGTVKKSHS